LLELVQSVLQVLGLAPVLAFELSLAAHKSCHELRTKNGSAMPMQEHYVQKNSLLFQRQNSDTQSYTNVQMTQQSAKTIRHTRPYYFKLLSNSRPKTRLLLYQIDSRSDSPLWKQVVTKTSTVTLSFLELNKSQQDCLNQISALSYDVTRLQNQFQ
jgi:hypothetical protein